MKILIRFEFFGGRLGDGSEAGKYVMAEAIIGMNNHRTIDIHVLGVYGFIVLFNIIGFPLIIP